MNNHASILNYLLRFTNEGDIRNETGWQLNDPDSPNPPPKGTMVDVLYRDGEIYRRREAGHGPAENWDFDEPNAGDILAWRYSEESSEWYDNIPPGGRLCWVSDIFPSPSRTQGAICVIIRYELPYFFDHSNTPWVHATPLTEEEIRSFLQPYNGREKQIDGDNTDA